LDWREAVFGTAAVFLHSRYRNKAALEADGISVHDNGGGGILVFGSLWIMANLNSPQLQPANDITREVKTPL